MSAEPLLVDVDWWDDGTGFDYLTELASLDATLDPPPDYAADPSGWLADTLGEVFWSAQLEVWRSTVENTHTAVLSCNNSGKTRIASRVAAWWVSTYWREGCRVVTTAPSSAQVKLLLWQEIRDAYNKAKERGKPFPGRIVESPYMQWKIGDATVAFGRKPADHQTSAMQGVHAPHVLVVLDEAGGISPAIWDAVEKITTTGHVSVLAIGNPDDPTAMFYKLTRPKSGWSVINIDGLRTPNMTKDRVGPLTAALMRHEHIPFSTEVIPDAIRPVMLNPDWVESGIRRWCGITDEQIEGLSQAKLGAYIADRTSQSQLFTVAVRGEFATVAGESVIPLGWVNRAVERWKDWVAAGRPDPEGRLIAGVDVATTNGADETCVVMRKGLVVMSVHRYPEGDTVETAERVVQHVAGEAQAMAVVDSIGIGAGVRDTLKRITGVQTVAFNASEQSHRTDRHREFKFRNDRAAAWWRLREMLDPAYGAALMLPDDQVLKDELTAPKWKVTIGQGIGVIQIEAKDDIRKRLGHSTDSADATIMSLWIDGAPLNATGTRPSAIPYAETQTTLPGGFPTPVGSGGVIHYEMNDPAGGGFFP